MSSQGAGGRCNGGVEIPLEASELTMKEAQDLIHWSETTEALEVGQSNGHFWLVVVIWIVLGKLSVEPSS